VVSALFIDYSQPDCEREFSAASAISSYYGIPLRRIAVSDCSVPEGYVPARNSLLLSLALMNFDHEYGLIALGIHAGTPYVDCSPDFVHEMQQVFDLYTNGRVRIDVPFLKWTKSEIWEYAQMKRVPVHLTHSNNLSDLRPAADELWKTR
jgi:7-cyano-7-deazaguanine synthase